MTLEYGRMDPDRLNSIIGNIHDIEKVQDMTTSEFTNKATADLREQLVIAATGTPSIDLNEFMATAWDAFDATAGEPDHIRVDEIRGAVERAHIAAEITKPVLDVYNVRDGFVMVRWFDHTVEGETPFRVSVRTCHGGAEPDSATEIWIGDDLVLYDRAALQSLIRALKCADVVAEQLGASRG